MVDRSADQPRIEELDSFDSRVAQILATVPRGEYLFLKDDVGNPAVIDSWRSRHGAHIFLAYLNDEAAGLLAVIPGLGWSKHVGELRMVVVPAHRGKGVGASLARRGLTAAVAAGLKKVSVEVLAEQESVAAVFTGLGFTAEALLADHVRDDRGLFHDLLVLSHPIEETWSTLAAIGLMDEGAPA